MPEDHPITPDPGCPSGIYTITCRRTGKMYVGSAVNIKKRWCCHVCCLRKNKHYSRHLQNAWNKHGEANFIFAVIESVPPEHLIAREQHWIDHHESYLRSRGFNLNRTADSCLGTRHSREARANMSAAAIGRKLSPETRAKVSAARKGKTLSPEQRAKLMAANIGRKHTAEIRARISAAQKGKTHSPETRAKISEAAKARTYSPEARARMSETAKAKTVSPETRAKLAEAQKGKTHSPETRAKIAAANKRRTHSPETRAKIAAARKARYATTPPQEQGPYRQGSLF